MNIGSESDTGGEKALKTHWASTLTPRLTQRGPIVIRPGDSGGPADMWCRLNCITLSAAFFLLNDKSEIKIRTRMLPYFTLRVFTPVRTSQDCFSGPERASLFVCAGTSDHVTDAKCLEVQQIYRGEWTVSEELE